MSIVLTDRAREAQDKARILQEALPWMTRWTGRVVVVKYGGNALARTPLDRKPAREAPEATLEGNALARTPLDRKPAREAPEATPEGNALVTPEAGEIGDPSFAADIALLRSVGVKVVVVHGGGPQISSLAERLGLETSFVDGRRVTDAATLEAVQMALLGQVNPMLVRMISDAGAPAVGVAGTDAGLVTARQHDPRLGLVGEVEYVDPTLLNQLLDADRVPVMATLCSTSDGAVVNVNADAVAGAVAAALGAEKLIYLTNVAGLYTDFGTKDSALLSEIGVERLRAMLEAGELATGMIPKVQSIVDALDGGVPQAHLLDGRIEHALLLEIFTDSGVGTMILPTSGETILPTSGETILPISGEKILPTSGEVPASTKAAR